MNIPIDGLNGIFFDLDALEITGGYAPEKYWHHPEAADIIAMLICSG